MKELKKILDGIHPIQSIGNLEVSVTGIQIDSRQIQPGNIFVAIRGQKADGHDFIPKALALGASVVVCEDLPDALQKDVVYLQVSSCHASVACLAHNFFERPTEKFRLIGVTGTNGKTTIATLLYKLFTKMGFKCGLVSTIQNIIGTDAQIAERTTPDAVSLNALLKQMADQGCQYVFMECSSHAIHQHRIDALHFAGGIFSNITHDHLDYHKTFAEYLRVKKSFFDNLPQDAFALSNKDDRNGEVMLQNTRASACLYSLRGPSDFSGKILDDSLSGLLMKVDDQEVHFRLIGSFNAYNLLAVYGAAKCLGFDSGRILTALSLLTGAEGRFDYQISPHVHIIGIVDYAHTPDALENVLNTIRQLRQGNARIITVAGCGGDRDKTKRPEMAVTVLDLSDYAILTSDNPRTEEPASILRDMEAGLGPASRGRYEIVENRRDAIFKAVAIARSGDILLLAGKGHEKYQEINGVKHPFDDKAVLSEAFELKNK